MASSLLNAGRQVGAAIGLAVLGTVAWTVVANGARAHAAAGPTPGRRVAPGGLPARAGGRLRPCLPGRRGDRRAPPGDRDRRDPRPPRGPGRPASRDAVPGRAAGRRLCCRAWRVPRRTSRSRRSPRSTGPRWKASSARPGPRTGAGACTGASAPATGTGRGRTTRATSGGSPRSGRPPGLLAFDGAAAVGWCELAPRADLGWLAQARYLQPADDLPVWSVPCFYVRRTHRRQGVMGALIAAAVAAAAAAGAPALEAYPVDTAVPGHSGNLFPGDGLGVRPPRLRGRGPAQARPPGHAPDPGRA